MSALNSSAAIALYDVSIPECVQIIRASRGRTVLAQGHMGTGKSSMLKMLAKALPTHHACYFDCTTKDLGDITIPQLQSIDGQGFVRYVTNEELGVHLNQPIILMIDEYGKANPAVKNALLRLMLERKSGPYTLHRDSVIFATTNLGAEGVGDLLPAHARNRITLLRTRKPTHTEWIEGFAVNAGVHHALIAWVSEKPELFQSFEDVPVPKGSETWKNEYIFHPMDKQRTSFVTPRSLEAASDWLHAGLPKNLLMSTLIGTIGPKAAAELVTFYDVAQQLPTLDAIKTDPFNAKVPTSDSATCMVVHRTLATIQRNWVDAWMDYMSRLDREAQLLFAMQVKRDDYAKRSDVMTNAKFTKWCLANNFAFSADKV